MVASLKYFEYLSAAERYAQGRPYVHPQVVDNIEQFVGVSRFNRGIDVACGTGQSTVALKRICEHVTATDISREMLDQVQEDERITYLRCPAERLDLPSDQFDIMTVGLAFHWFERDPFLKEAYRVLVAGGWLVIYQNFFYGKMKDNPEFADWIADGYLVKYPVPPRNSAPLAEEDARRYGFSLVGEENYSSDVDFTINELAAYLSTQTNMIDAIESGRISIQDALGWITTEVGKFFVKDRQTFRFGGWIIYLKKGNLCCRDDHG